MSSSLNCDEPKCLSQKSDLRSGIAAVINVKWKGTHYSFCCWECVAKYADTKSKSNNLLFH